MDTPSRMTTITAIVGAMGMLGTNGAQYLNNSVSMRAETERATSCAENMSAQSAHFAKALSEQSRETLDAIERLTISYMQQLVNLADGP